MRSRNAEHIEKLSVYFKRNLKKGYTIDSLKWALVNQGYSRVIIDEALTAANKELAREAPVMDEKPVITHEIIEEPIIEKKSWWKKLFGL